MVGYTHQKCLQLVLHVRDIEVRTKNSQYVCCCCSHILIFLSKWKNSWTIWMCDCIHYKSLIHIKRAGIETYSGQTWKAILWIRPANNFKNRYLLMIFCLKSLLNSEFFACNSCWIWPLDFELWKTFLFCFVSLLESELRFWCWDLRLMLQIICYWWRVVIGKKPLKY